jgi:folate-binding protein YgfZ
LYDAFLYKDAEDACYLEIDAKQVESVKEHLMRYKLRSKFKLEDIDPVGLSVYAMTEQLDASAGSCMAQQPDRRGPDMGYRVLANPADISAHHDASPLSAYTIRRFLRGIPEGSEEFGNNASGLPLERNLDLMGGVDFHKGCYLGQELTVRTYHTGVIRKRVLPIRLAETVDALPVTAEDGIDEGSGEIVYPDAPLDVKTEGPGRPTGRVIGQLGNIGLALYRLDKLESGPGKIASQNTFVRAFAPVHWPGSITRA